jgi:hypothetical protein
MHNTAQDAPIVDPTRAGLGLLQELLEYSPHPIAEPELTCHHSSSAVCQLESCHHSCVNYLIEF